MIELMDILSGEWPPLYFFPFFPPPYAFYIFLPH